MRLENFVSGAWIHGDGHGYPLVDPVSGDEIARASSRGVDLVAGLDHARRRGGPALKHMTYAQRGALLARIAEVLTSNRDAYYRISLENSGSTRPDAAFDVDGGIGTLQFYAGLGKRLGDVRVLMEPGSDRLGRDENFLAAHVLTPLPGVAVHINAFNFPSWGLWEKAAVALLSGMPVFAKPAAATALLAQRMVRDVVDDGVLPDGALSLICADGYVLTDLVQPGDAVAFTGAAATVAHLRTAAPIARGGVRFNAEADSLNAAVLGPDADADSDEFAALIQETVHEMTHKSGQKCTAIRRVLVPEDLIDAVQAALIGRLEDIRIGDPRNDIVQMGPLVNLKQQAAAWAAVNTLHAEARIVFGGGEHFEVIDADEYTGAFFPPTLLRCDDPDKALVPHAVEAFGPVATLMPYRDFDHACALAARGQGSLVASIYTGDDAVAAQAVQGFGAWHGRLALIDARVAKATPGHGTVMPQCVHGGPGRAGGGEELGGLRGLGFYHQRTAIQAHGERLEALRARAAAC